MKADADHDVDRVAEIERLASLDPIDYEVARIEEAKRLGMRASMLDRVVAAKHRALGLDTDDDDNGQGRAVKITDVSSWPEPVGGDQIATTLAAVVKTYAVLPGAAADAIALWILHTWLVNAFMISPRLAVISPTKGCGKTTILRLLNKLARRPKRAGSISPAALFRVVERFQPTMLLDETEKYIEHGGDLHALINEGHCKGATVLRVLTDKQELREFAVFGAVAFARNGRLPDDLEQRSIIIEMQRRRADEPLAELREDRTESLHRVARMCARWAEDNAARVADCNDPDMSGVINRNADNWRVVFTIADMVGADWPERIRDAAVALTPRESESVGPMLLADIKDTFADKKTDRLASAQACEALAAMEGRPWAEWKAGKPITPNQLARLLKAFGIVSDSVRIGDRTPKGYYRSQFEEAWQRYLAVEGVHKTQHRNNADETGTSSTFQNATEGTGVADQNCEKPNNDTACCGVAGQKGGNGSAQANDEPSDPAAPPPTREPDLSIPDFLRRPPGLSWREIDRIAKEVEDWAYAHRDEVDLSQQSVLEAEIRRRLAGMVFPEAIEIELERVTRSLFDTKEALVSIRPENTEDEHPWNGNGQGDGLDIPECLRRNQ